MKTLALLAVVLLTGCGVFRDPIDFIEPVDDPPAPYTCTSKYFGHVESEVPVDCTLVDWNVYVAKQSVFYFTRIKNDEKEYLAILRVTTLHIRAVTHWNSVTEKSGSMFEEVSGEAWFDRIDVGSDMYALAHETLHEYDLHKWHLDTCFHPGWDKTGPEPLGWAYTCTNGWSCDYYEAQDAYNRRRITVTTTN